MNDQSRRARRAQGKARLAVVAAVWCAAFAPITSADVYRLVNAGDSVIGTPFYVKASAKHTLLDIGRHHGAGFDEMEQANPTVDMWVPGDGAEVMVPAQYVLPNTPREGIVVNLAEKRMFYFRSPTEIETFPLGIGRDGWETPVGSYSIIEKTENPTWTPPASIRKRYEEEGKTLPAVVPAGPDNPLGAYRLRLSNPSYLIHGTNKPWGVGMPVSSGCMRMFPEDIAHLFGKVEVGTPVKVVDQPFKIGWLGDKLYLEVNAHSDAAKSKSIRDIVPPSIASADGVTVDWDEVRRAVEENAGLPRLVGGRQGSKSWHHLDMIF